MKRPKGFREEPEFTPVSPSSPATPESHVEHPTAPGEEETTDFSTVDLSTVDLSTVDPPTDTGPTVDLSAVARSAVVKPADAQPAALAKQARLERSERVRNAKRQVRSATKQRRRREREERRRFTQFSRERRRRIVVALSALTLLVLFVGVGLFTPLMSARTIEVVGASRVSQEAIVNALDGVAGEPLALVSDDEVFTALESFQLIETYALEKVPPSTLRVVITERQPILATITGEAFTLLDPSGVQIETVTAEHLPETIPVFRGAPPDPTSPIYRAVSTALRNMPNELKAQINEISANTPQQITLLLRTGVRVIWGDASETARKSIVFTTMVEALGDRPASIIDVSAPGAPVYVP